MIFVDEPGGVSERFKEPVLKTGDLERDRGFESHLLRQAYFLKINSDVMSTARSGTQVAEEDGLLNR